MGMEVKEGDRFIPPSESMMDKYYDGQFRTKEDFKVYKAFSFFNNMIQSWDLSVDEAMKKNPFLNKISGMSDDEIRDIGEQLKTNPNLKIFVIDGKASLK